MKSSILSLRLGQAAESSGHDHDGYCSGRLTLGPEGRLALSVVCNHCGETVAEVGSLEYQLEPKLGPSLDLAA